ncbi:hypothetical protein [Luteibacter sp. 329MFSha]|uniref:hypothetical protein n=1 Tax=Luteibacter sp. 329MFSha TaxID=1798239 RepID=UPI001113CEA0|nr:hypothetical protein [Luteibacter sp. 329MFSha]
MDPQARRDMLDEMDAEAFRFSGTGTSQLPVAGDIVPPLDLSGGVSESEIELSTAGERPFASYAARYFNYVDSYAADRNGGQATGLNFTYTFRAPDEQRALMTNLALTEPPPEQGTAIDRLLVGGTKWFEGLREQSRENIGNSSSAVEAAFNSGVYAVNSLTSAVVGGAVAGGRIFTNGGVRNQFLQGMGVLVTTDPRTTASVAWDHWREMSTEDQLIAAGSALVTLGAGATKAGELGAVAREVRILDEVSDTRRLTLEPTSGIVPNTADALTAGADVRVSSRPQWLQRLDAGNDFNTERASAYPYNEVYVNKADGLGYYRLDSYDPAAGEIVSRKFTQLSDVQENTAVRYINEISAKYPVNGVIADVPSSGDLSGQLLRGQYYLEVPVQARPIPQPVLDAANRQGVLIRDINGRVY